MFSIMESRDRTDFGRWPSPPPHLQAGVLLGNNLGRWLSDLFRKIAPSVPLPLRQGKINVRADGYCLLFSRNTCMVRLSWQRHCFQNQICKASALMEYMWLAEKCATVIQVIFQISGVCLSGLVGFCILVACSVHVFPYRLFRVNKP